MDGNVGPYLAYQAIYEFDIFIDGQDSVSRGEPAPISDDALGGCCH